MSRLLECDFLLRPLESVHFGSPRSFSGGESHLARSEFPPSPYTFQGMVRTQFLQAVTPALDLDDWSRSARQEREDLVGGPDSLPPGWQLTGAFPASLQKTEELATSEWDFGVAVPWTPTPRFLLKANGSGCQDPVFARPVRSTHPGLNDLNNAERLLGAPTTGSSKPLGGWVSPLNLSYALTGQGEWLRNQHSSEMPPFVRLETRPGLAVDRQTASARHALLYTLESLRFAAGSGLLGRFSGRVDDRIDDSALTHGGVTAGRKGRPATFQRVGGLCRCWRDLIKGLHLPEEVAPSDGFWLLALTPARVDGEVERALQAVMPDAVRVVVQVGLTGPPQTIGGYRLAKGESRPNLGYHPAGSAWLFTLQGGSPAARGAVLRQLNNAHLLAVPREAPFGFGHVLVGLGPSMEARKT